MRVQKVFTKPSRTKQAFKDECDINLIVKRYKKQTGVDLAEVCAPAIGGSYGDYSDVVDYRTACDRIIAADESFGALPAIIRKRFDNDPAVFLDFCHDEKNLPELIKMGLAKEPIQPSQGNSTDVGA